MNLIIDEGNTRVKLAIYEDSQLVKLLISEKSDCKADVDLLLSNYSVKSVIVSSVTNEIINLIKKTVISQKVILSNRTPVPFKNLYSTPNTLGVDRIALVAAAYYKYKKQHALIVDVGTCITYDFINMKGKYLGGAISPGLKMRLKSMSVFTKKLPDVNLPDSSVKIIGVSTHESMVSGVLNGVAFEIDGFIERYRQEFKNINVILTGGDAILLYKQLKNSIFVDSNFLLEGLNSILVYQNQLK